MKKRTSVAAPKGKAKEVAESFLTSPVMPFSRGSPKPMLFDFDLKGFNTSSFSSKTKKSIMITATTSSPAQKTLTTISDLKNLVSSRSDSLKRQIDLSHSEILKEFEASHSRLSKRFKMHEQTCQQVADEADKEYKKLSDMITENVEAMKTSYAESITKAEASATRVSKTSIAELSQSMEKAIEGLRSRYGISMNAA